LSRAPLLWFFGNLAPPDDGGAFSFGVFNFVQTPRRLQEEARRKDGARGTGESPMNDAQRYRMNAAECLSAVERCAPPYRDLTLAIAASWVSLARQQIAMDELLAIWSEASTDKLADTSPRRFQYPRDLRNPLSSASTRYAALPTPRAKLAGELFAAAGLR
jgi:hypothetical protein